jgi:peroxisomal membrane protein 2
MQTDRIRRKMKGARGLRMLLVALGCLASSAFVPLVPKRTEIRQGSHPLEASGLVEGISQAWDAYSNALDTNPLVVKSVTASLILGAADFTGQQIEGAQSDEAKNLDLVRVARFAFFGLALQAPWNHFYYLLLDGALPPTPEPFTPTTGIKVIIDQFIQAPIFTVLIFYFLGLLEVREHKFQATKLLSIHYLLSKHILTSSVPG